MRNIAISNIHGHPKTLKALLWDQLKVRNDEQVICIENGIFKKGETGIGSLCAFDFAKNQLFFQKNID